MNTTKEAEIIKALRGVAEALHGAGPRITALVALDGSAEDARAWRKVQDAYKKLMELKEGE